MRNRLCRHCAAIDAAFLGCSRLGAGQPLSRPASNTRKPLVRMRGLEPPRLSALEPKSSASTSSATSASGRRSRLEGDAAQGKASATSSDQFVADGASQGIAGAPAVADIRFDHPAAEAWQDLARAEAGQTDLVALS